MSNNPKCRVLLSGEVEPRENVEVFSNNDQDGIAFLPGRQVSVRHDRQHGGWYEASMQILEANARLEPKEQRRSGW
jgi:hypothetical protein